MRFYRHNQAGDAAPPILAMQVSQQTIAEIAIWTGGVVVKELISGEDPDKEDSWMVGINVPVVIGSSQGMDRASEGDFVIQDVAGGRYVYKGRDFHNTFTEVPVRWPSPMEPRGLKPRGR